MTNPGRTHTRRTLAALLALALVASALGPVGTAVAQPSVTVTQSADATTVAPGETVTITAEFAVTELNAPQLSASLPDGWSIDSQSAEGPVAYNDGTWTWLAGDGDGVNVTYTVEYVVSVPDDAAVGEYEVASAGSAVSPADSAPTSDDAVTTITVAEPDDNEAPTAAFDVSPGAPEQGETVTFDASASTDADGAVASYAWDFDGDGATDATGVQPTTTYDDAGDYDVTLTVTDDDGATASTTQTVGVTASADDGDDAPTNDTDDGTGAAPATAVSLSPESELVAANGSTTFDLVVSDADGGVGAYVVTVSVDDPSVASIASVDLAGVSNDGLTDVEIAPDGSSATVEAVLVDTPDTGSVPLGTITVETAAEGTATVALDVTELGTEAGDAYDVTAASGATVESSALVVGASDAPAQDLDDDGDFEDVNGDGSVDLLDVQTLFAGRDGAAVQNTPEAFDFNGDGEFTLLDVQALFAQETE